MNRESMKAVACGVLLATAQTGSAGTDVYFNPLTQSAAVANPNHINELNSPWQMPPGLSQVNLMSLDEVEEDFSQSVLRVPGAGTSASMFDMVAFDSKAQYIFIPHETPFGAGVSRYDIENDETQLLFSGDLGGLTGNWSNDYGAFDPSTWTPNNTLLVAEEWTAEGRVIEILNPYADPADIQIRELDSIANVAHEGLRFSRDERTLYFVDEWNSGSIYKFVLSKRGDYTKGQTFVLVVDAFIGEASANYNEGVNAGSVRTGLAQWVPITDKNGIKLTAIDPFRNGPTDDPRVNPATRGGRGAADEVKGTPFGRPEDMEVGRLGSGNEVVYFTATSENSIYSIEMQRDGKAFVRLAASEASTPKNVGFAPTTGRMNSPDNLAQDALGNIYIIEDAPNGDVVGGDVWFMRDVDSDGVAESLDHFLSIQVDGAEATGMIFNPKRPTEFVVAVQHPDSTDLARVTNGFGDAVWRFDLTDVVPPPCATSLNSEAAEGGAHSRATCTNTRDFRFIKMLERAGSNDRGKDRW